MSECQAVALRNPRRPLFVEDCVLDLVQPSEFAVPQRLECVSLASHSRTLKYTDGRDVVGICRCCHQPEPEPVEGGAQECPSSCAPDAPASELGMNDVADDAVSAGGTARLSGAVASRNSNPSRRVGHGLRRMA